MKIGYIAPLLGFFPFVLVALVLVLSFAGGGSVTSVNPIEPPATAETAQRYGITCSELGAPWDIVLLTDAFFAYQNGEHDIEDVNPIYTALEFVILQEDVEKWQIIGYSSVSDGDDETEDEETPVYDWVSVPALTTYHKGKNEILSYAGLDVDDLEDINPSIIISKAQEVAANKNDDETRYSISIKVNANFEDVLKNVIGLNDENTEKIIQLHESKYLQYLYFADSFDFEGNYTLPDIVIGSVTRLQLADVAASIIGHPYYWGGKSNERGVPKGPLDCSGFVDWVYYQCFGQGISGGVPKGNITLNGTAIQYYSCAEIDGSELQIGDLGFYKKPEDVTDYNHVGIYIGEIDGQKAFIHCGGSSFGYSPERPSGRVGISINSGGVLNNINPLGGTFDPPMKGANFCYFRRPQFQFIDDD